MGSDPNSFFLRKSHLAPILAALIGSVLAACSASSGAGGSTTDLTISVGETERSFRLYVPQEKSARPALVLVLHGRGGDAAEIERRTRGKFNTLADRDGFIVGYPDSLRGYWHSGHAWIKTDADDVGFLAALIDALATEYQVDRGRIYVTGFSNGAAMAYRLACERPEVIAALAPVAGGLAEPLHRPCAARSKRPIPLLVVHGTADPIDRFDSGELEGNLQYWIRRNGCVLTPAVTYLPAGASDDATRTRVESYANCSAGADVALYAIEGCGHHWPGGGVPFRWRDQGPECSNTDAVSVIWNFFKQHPKDPRTLQPN